MKQLTLIFTFTLLLGRSAAYAELGAPNKVSGSVKNTTQFLILPAGTQPEFKNLPWNPTANRRFVLLSDNEAEETSECSKTDSDDPCANSPTAEEIDNRKQKILTDFKKLKVETIANLASNVQIQCDAFKACENDLSCKHQAVRNYSAKSKRILEQHNIQLHILVGEARKYFNEQDHNLKAMERSFFLQGTDAFNKYTDLNSSKHLVDNCNLN